MILRSRSADDLQGSPARATPSSVAHFVDDGGGEIAPRKTASVARKGYIFRSAITFDPLYVVLAACSYYVSPGWFQVDANVFRKMVYRDLHTSFLREIRDWYYPAKWRKYGDKPITFTSFTTIIRQICKQLNHEFSTRIVYDSSVCNTVYFVCTTPHSPLNVASRNPHDS